MSRSEELDNGQVPDDKVNTICRIMGHLVGTLAFRSVWLIAEWVLQFKPADIDDLVEDA